MNFYNKKEIKYIIVKENIKAIKKLFKKLQNIVK